MKANCTRSNTTPCCPQPQLSHLVSPQSSQKPTLFSMWKSQSPLHTQACFLQPSPRLSPLPASADPFSPSLWPLVLSNKIGHPLTCLKTPEMGDRLLTRNNFSTSRLWWVAVSHRIESSLAWWPFLPPGCRHCCCLGLAESWRTFNTQRVPKASMGVLGRKSEKVSEGRVKPCGWAHSQQFQWRCTQTECDPGAWLWWRILLSACTRGCCFVRVWERSQWWDRLRCLYSLQS